MRSQASPLLLSELHPLPVLVAGCVLPAEFHPERLGRRAFGGGDVRLELHRVGAGSGECVDERVRQSQTAIMRQRDLAHHKASSGAQTLHAAGRLGHRPSPTACDAQAALSVGNVLRRYVMTSFLSFEVASPSHSQTCPNLAFSPCERSSAAISARSSPMAACIGVTTISRSPVRPALIR